MDEQNPAHICMGAGCHRFLGHRGWCCEDCYNTSYPLEKDSEKYSRQGLIVTINQLHDLMEELEKEFKWDGGVLVTDDNRKFQINIINKEDCSDTWEIEGVYNGNEI